MGMKPIPSLNLSWALIFDADAKHRRLVKAMLNLEEIDCLEADGIVPALRTAITYPIDLLLISDVNDGEETVMLLRLIEKGALGQPPPPIFLMADTTAPITQGSLLADSRISHVISRPVRSAELHAAITSIFNFDDPP